jgi:hypothetical protein
VKNFDPDDQAGAPAERRPAGFPNTFDSSGPADSVKRIGHVSGKIAFSRNIDLLFRERKGDSLQSARNGPYFPAQTIEI